MILVAVLAIKLSHLQISIGAILRPTELYSRTLRARLHYASCQYPAHSYNHPPPPHDVYPKFWNEEKKYFSSCSFIPSEHFDVITVSLSAVLTLPLHPLMTCKSRILKYVRIVNGLSKWMVSYRKPVLLIVSHWLIDIQNAWYRTDIRHRVFFIASG